MLMAGGGGGEVDTVPYKAAYLTSCIQLNK